MGHVVDALLEIFTWAGLGAGALVTLIALFLRLADGTWVPVRAVVEHTETGMVVRWFGDDGAVGEAPLSEDEARTIGDRDMADIFVRRGVQNRMRLTAHSPGVRAIMRLGLGLLALGALALIVSWVLLFVRG